MHVNSSECYLVCFRTVSKRLFSILPGTALTEPLNTLVSPSVSLSLSLSLSHTHTSLPPPRADPDRAAPCADAADHGAVPAGHAGGADAGAGRGACHIALAGAA